MTAHRAKDFDATPEAPVRTNWRVMLTLLAAGFGCGGIYWEMRGLRAEVDRLSTQMAEDYKQRVQMQGDIRELTALVRGRQYNAANGKLSRDDRD